MMQGQPALGVAGTFTLRDSPVHVSIGRKEDSFIAVFNIHENQKKKEKTGRASPPVKSRSELSCA